MTPYEGVYGQKPPSVATYLPWASKAWVVESLLHNRQLALDALKANLVMAQNHMKQQDNQHHSKWPFEVVDKIFL